MVGMENLEFIWFKAEYKGGGGEGKKDGGSKMEVCGGIERLQDMCTLHIMYIMYG